MCFNQNVLLASDMYYISVFVKTETQLPFRTWGFHKSGNDLLDTRSTKWDGPKMSKK